MVLFDPTNNGFVELDASGAELWDRLVESDWHEPALVTHLVDVHQLAAQEAGAVVDAYLDELARHGVIRRE